MSVQLESEYIAVSFVIQLDETEMVGVSCVQRGPQGMLYQYTEAVEQRVVLWKYTQFGCGFVMVVGNSVVGVGVGRN